ncbi:ATPase family protein [Dictyocaulus viviparus]|uniref:Dynein heavy chain, cytoplasmic n=1 Tax=Dictyocaulus viviparus TaxID=29172 RepID=A0A0D8XRK6_DICVI|nr:ATPase family protein [Dictyocaulus viviparus]
MVLYCFKIRLTAQTIYISPSIEQARAKLLEQLVEWHAVVTSQPRISSTRFQLAMNRDHNVATYKNVLSCLPNGLGVLENAYITVDRILREVDDYVNEWLRYQALWDLQAEMLYERLGVDLSKWMKTLVEIRKSRTTFDTQDTKKEIFPVIVDYAKVQLKVTLKYDYWHKEVLQKFGTAVGNEMQQFFGNISKWRDELESQGVDSGTTTDAVALITYVQALKKQTKIGQETVDQFRAAQRLLSQQRYQFPTQWLYAENVEGEWSALMEILLRKDSSIQSQISNLQTKIRDENDMVEKRTHETLAEWERAKPVEGAQRPNEALAALNTFEQKIAKLAEDREKMRKARHALDMADPTGVPADADKLAVAAEELADLKGVWQALTPVYTSIDEMKEKTWLSVQPRKLRQSLDDLMNQLKHLPVKYKSYKSYEYAKQMMHNYSKMNMLVVELKSDALKERHWRQMMKELRVNWNLSELTLGQVWDADLQRHEHSIKQILLVAQGELALEEFLKQMKDFWQSYDVELVNYQNKTRLIKGWDELFNKLKEHQNSLAAMKLSPYYKQFEENALSWEEKLNRISAMFDVWIDVQRRWVYLEGLFSGSADIATLLPIESARFSSLSTEFLALMKKVTQSPRILDVVGMQGAQRLLDRLADMLSKIQKALGEYLERERSSFPRFYFVGDEDLLEIMGNSKDISRLQKHLKKMFAGVTAIDVEEENRTVTGLRSREDELVELVQPVHTKDIRINEWLKALEAEMKHTLARLLASSLIHFSKLDIDDVKREEYMEWLDKYPAQVITLTAEIWWSNQMEIALADGKSVEVVEHAVSATLALLADSVLKDQPPIRRKKIEALITEFVHKRDTCRRLTTNNVKSLLDFEWLQCMRFYFDPKQPDATRCCILKIANAQFFYGFEYLGIQERLVRTPLTDRCFLTMTQALHSRLGGSPFGPAGTGKTESVKALGHQLGRFVLVFNCDETFDFQAMGRILVGLCQVGAWGCFDEFNRLEERMLSAVSQQIQTIQEAVRAGGEMSVDLVGKRLNVNANIGIFITMNPGYSGRSNLPDNLKQLFRSLAMTQPDRQLIAQVMLFSQGFRTAETLANKIVPLFILCKEQLSAQCHYDFGLRALKYVLVSAGNVKREKLAKMGAVALDDVAEQQMLIQSVCETLVPKLVSEDIALLFSLLSDVFPSVHYTPNQMIELRQHIAQVCDEFMLCHADIAGELGAAWVGKVLQLYQITNLNHGLMLVGASGSGKTTAWKVLLKALERFEKVEGVSHVIDAKAMCKDALYGVLDPNTREWTDGLFTSIIRRIIDNVRGEIDKRQWIIFDGDVDPEWVENLNSVLDDNKLLTLPNGERLAIPPNVRIIFEVADLRYATLATVSRCGMVWFSGEIVTTEMLFEHYLARLRNVSIESDVLIAEDAAPTRSVIIQRQAAACLQPNFSPDSLVPLALNFALTNLDHVMVPTQQRLLSSFFAMMNYSVRNIISHDSNQGDFPLSPDQIETYITRSMLTNMIWAFSGDGKWKCRQKMSDFIRNSTTLSLPANQQAPLIDFEVQLSGDWQPWISRVPVMEIESHRVAAADIVVPTIDTVRHEMLLSAWLSEHKPLVLCGPPGSGKTMTLLAALRSQQDMDVVNVNFSSSTTPELLMKTFDHYCEYRRTPNGIVLAPVQLSRWLVIFCDEINLPAPDKYGTQRVICFLRQLVEMNGFYRNSDHSWVTLERIQFVGACNPPTDPGRHPMTLRFLRHVPVVYVDYPGHTSLIQIYGTFNRAMLKTVPNVRGLADPLTNAMVDVYLASQEHFTQDDQPHYVYSPRELTRWVRGISEAIAPVDGITAEQLVRLWAHEAVRLFQDRLVTNTEREWTDELVDSTAEKYFGGACNVKEALQRPLLYSCWLSKHYVPVTRDELKDYVSARLKGFYEEELDVQLVLFDQMLDHVLRIDRIYRQPQGHLLLIGTAGAGKTTLSRFVAWLNGLSVFQASLYFDEDMRSVLRRAGCRNEKMCFIMDESNMLDTGFLERLNTLLANGEVMRNLHVVFTMNPSGSGLRERASTSPALFNRCVLNWFGDWADNALYQVASELTTTLDMDRNDYEPPFTLPKVCDLVSDPPTYRHAVINTLVHVHKSVQKLNEQEQKRGHRVMVVTPRHFLDLIKHFMNLFHEKRRELEEEKAGSLFGIKDILFLKSCFAEEKKTAANLKLKEMLADQQKAEDEKRHSEQLQKELSQQLTQIAVKKTEVQKDLSQVSVILWTNRCYKEFVFFRCKVEPAVEEAQQAVKGIRKNQLVEVRSMASPPVMVKLALEAICILLGENVGTDWKAIRGVMVKDDFMPRILAFDTDSITTDILKQMDKYVNNPDWDFDKVNRASQACGPMVKWAKAQLLYSGMLHKVEPLRNELKRLESDAMKKTTEGNEVKARIAQLEQSIAAYKEEYAQLIGQAESIKMDLATVQEKVGRSTELLSSLRSERDRWSGGCDGFAQQMDTLVGDALLSGAFLAYAGYFDQQLRDVLFHRWIEYLQGAAIKMRSDLARIEYLSTVDDRLQWQRNALPVDDLCSENAIMLHRFNRYPLIIDPSGQASEFIMKQFAARNIQKTSFLDDSFRKNLESALRFGNSLLVQDVESYDPILNPVLNREVKRTGGRVLITIGDQDIDLSPAFQIFLITRDASGEFAVRLRQLEKALLAALNESKGKILDDNSVISTLEKLKNEASEIAKKAAETDKVMAEVEAVSTQYQRLAAACSQIFHTLQQLNEVHFLYHYSLDFLLDIFTSVLKSPDLAQTQDHIQRLNIITSNLFQTVYRRVSRGMLHADKVLLALLLMRISLRSVGGEPSYDAQWDLLLGRSELLSSKNAHQPSPTALPFISSQQMGALNRVQKLPGFENIIDIMCAQSSQVKQWMTLDNPEASVPILWEDPEQKLCLKNPIISSDLRRSIVRFSAPIGVAMNQLIVVHCLRSDRLMASAHRLVSAAFGEGFMQQDKVIDLHEIIDNEACAVFVCSNHSATGYDASGKIEDLGIQTGRPVTSIAIGSSEGFSQADAALTAASKSGRWVLLKNVHLAPQWLGNMEKRLHTLKPHANFRLFLTAEIHPKLPTSILRASRLVVFEPATGLKANLLRSLSALPASRLAKAPAERSRLYLLVCWLHALVQERLRYTPLGWANAYEFSDADLRVACDTLDAAVDAVAQGRANVAPEKLPWSTLRTLLGQCIYGGKIDNQFDQLLLDCILERLFTPKSFEPEHVLVNRFDGDSSLCTPDATQRDQLLAWVEAIKSQQLPAWLGLSNNAEKVLLTLRGETMLKNLLKVSDDELAFTGDGEKEAKPQWMAQIGELAQQWLKLLPKDITRMKRTVDNIKDPLFRFFEREINLGGQLLSDIRHDLEEILGVCRAERKQSNETRALASALQKGVVPANWLRYTVPKDVTVMDWVIDFNERVRQLIRIGNSSNLKAILQREEVWLGGTFSPEAYITATRQEVAQTNTWSLEQLHLHVIIGRTDRFDVVRLTGMELRGAETSGGNTLRLSDEVKTTFDCAEFSWKQEPPDGVRLPLYLYGDRKQLVTSLSFSVSSANSFYERGVALVANSSLS